MLLNRMQKNILTKPIMSNFLKVILIYISLYTVYNKKWMIDWLIVKKFYGRPTTFLPSRNPLYPNFSSK